MKPHLQQCDKTETEKKEKKNLIPLSLRKMNLVKTLEIYLAILQ